MGCYVESVLRSRSAAGTVRWCAGAELVRTSVGTLHVVGDVSQPMVLAGVGEAVVDWLLSITGARSAAGEVAYAQTFGVSKAEARYVLDQLLVAQALSVGARGAVERQVSVIGADVREMIAAQLQVPADRVHSLARPTERAGWVFDWDQIIDAVAQDFVVFALARSVADSAEDQFAQRLMRAGIPHLIAGAGPMAVRLGPIVNRGGPCMHCDELARVDAEPSWGALSLQLAAAGESPPLPGEDAATLLAAETARHVRAWQAGESPVTLGVVAENRKWGGTWQYRPISRHHQCECWWPV